MRAGRGDARGSTSSCAARPERQAPADASGAREPGSSAPGSPRPRWSEYPRAARLPACCHGDRAGGLGCWVPSGMVFHFSSACTPGVSMAAAEAAVGAPGTRGFAPLPPWPPCPEGGNCVLGFPIPVLSSLFSGSWPQ